MGRLGCPLAPPKGLGVHAPKQEKVHIASKWDTTHTGFKTQVEVIDRCAPQAATRKSQLRPHRGCLVALLSPDTQNAFTDFNYWARSDTLEFSPPDINLGRL
jgi:hypothetical protein